MRVDVVSRKEKILWFERLVDPLEKVLLSNSGFFQDSANFIPKISLKFRLFLRNVKQQNGISLPWYM